VGAVKLYPYTRTHRRLQRLKNWFNILTSACADNGWFWLAVTAFCVSAQLIFHPDLTRRMVAAFWYVVNGG